MRKLCVSVAMLLLAVALAAPGQIPVNGLTDMKVYSDKVAFTVPAEAGYGYLLWLDTHSVNAGVPVTVNLPDYHELRVFRTNLASGEVAGSLVRFIVKASERGDSEWGLPPWTPYPMIPSTGSEVADAHLRLILPADYPKGLEIPVIAWIENEAGKPVRANGSLTADGHPSFQIRRGAGSGFLASTNPAGSLDYAARFINLVTNRAMNIETNTLWTPVSGSLTGSVTWGVSSRVAITNSLTIPAGSTLAIEAGAVIRLDRGVDIHVNGRLLIAGTADRPVVFVPASRSQPWGGFFLTNSTSHLEATGTIFTGSGANQNGVPNSHRHEQCLFYCDNHATLALTDCAAIDLAGQFGHGVDRGQPWTSITITRSLIQRCTTGGEWNGCSFHFLQSALLETPIDTPTFNDGDEDGIYFTTGEYEVRDSLIGWTRDDGIDSGSGGAGTVTVTNTWIESTYHEAFAWSGGNRVTTNLHTVCLNCGQGIECGYSLTDNSPMDFVQDSLSTANGTGARFGDNYDWTYNGFLRVTNSLILYNYRDIWGMNWDDWTYRVGEMNLQSNFVTAVNTNHPNNTVWDPARDGGRLAEFMTTPPGAPVGIGLAVRTNQLAFASLSNGLPVRLSSFTTNFVSVDFSLENDAAILASGTVQFAPGETVKRIPMTLSEPKKYDSLRIALQNPIHGEITGLGEAWLKTESTHSSSIVLISIGSFWKYLDDGSNQGTNWIGVTFNDAGWSNGAAELGYGDRPDGRPEATEIRYGANASSKHVTYYFRKIFALDSLAGVTNAQVRILRDDGAAAYLNGREIFRDNLPDGPIDYLTLATNATDDGTVFYSGQVDPGLLRVGTNVLAVEVHQATPGSSDLSFDAEFSVSGMRIKPAITGFSLAGSLATVSMSAFPGFAYFLEYKDDLYQAAWIPLATSVAQTGGALSLSDTNPPARQRFYRIRME